MITVAKIPLYPPNEIPKTLLNPRVRGGGAVVCFNLGFNSKPKKKEGFFGLIGLDYEIDGMELWRKLSRSCIPGSPKKGQKVEVESDNGGEDFFDAATAEAKVQPQHLVVMVNGLAGSTADWTYAAEQFVKRLPDKVIVHRSERNTSKLTFDGVDLMGERLAEEVVNVVKHWPGLHKISFVAHSLGGLIARYAIGRLYELSTEKETANQTDSSGGEGNDSGEYLEKHHEAKIAGLEPMNFITLATPHLGSIGHKQLPLLCGLPFLEKSAPQTAHWIAGRSGKHLFLTDDDSGKPPLLLRMVNDSEDLKFMSALRSFKRRVAYANANYDHIVGWRTSSIRRQSELPKSKLLVRDEKYPHIIHVDEGKAEGNSSKTLSDVKAEMIDFEEEMIRGLSQVPWERIDVSFQKSKQRYVAHNTIQVNRYWMNSDGADVVEHVIDNFIV
ncbi:OLC1v1035242C1 [Oldenlandia corymbosa var. corymbosa]|uniref:OLC1v1035242C1 n=1 Tax=Oldenlandia corymbosa var. corymbosa TaxID=529605 RepID=A0AAV1CT16_OLDCO|nr:OLC1v1035242C1 [Oldenlandia corymbosa var. corymbosa]